jgi:biotin carboxyl carrier protein
MSLPSSFTLKVSGKKFSLSSKDSSLEFEKFETRPGGWIIATDVNGKRHRFSIEEVRGKLSFSVLKQSGFGEIQMAAALFKSAGASVAQIAADLTAQFPGKVRKILVKAGAVVAEGEPLLLVEAMKMEFAIKAPVAGLVVKFLVAEGQQLSPGDRFLDFEGNPSG